jgi:hypothetical protein
VTLCFGAEGHARRRALLLVVVNRKGSGRSRRTGKESVISHKLGTVRCQSPEGLYASDFNNVSLIKFTDNHSFILSRKIKLISVHTAEQSHLLLPRSEYSYYIECLGVLKLLCGAICFSGFYTITAPLYFAYFSIKSIKSKLI